MIHLNIEGKSWPEVTEQLAGLIRENGQSTGDDAALREELEETRANLNQATGILQSMRADLEASHRRIAELEAALATPAEEGPSAENPTTAAEPEQETCNSADASETDGAMNDAPAPATTEPAQPKYKKEDVRSFLAQAREKGVNITDVLKPFGGRFPSVDEKDYPALMEATKKALAEKGAK